MNKKTCLVTGGTSGVGKAISLGIAKAGHRVVIVARNELKGENAVREIIKKSSNIDVNFLSADLSIQSSIRELSEEFKSKYGRLDVLVNCAGILKLKKEVTEDGIDSMLAVDYLSHFLLTNLLIDLLVKSTPSRVVTVVGSPRYIENIRIDFDDIQFKKNYNGFRAAIACAVMRAVFTFTLAERMKHNGVSSNCFHPGLVKSHLGRYLPIYVRPIVNTIMLFIPRSCPTGVYLAISDEVEGVTGKFFIRKKPVSTKLKVYAEQIGERLWEISESLTFCGG